MPGAGAAGGQGSGVSRGPELSYYQATANPAVVHRPLEEAVRCEVCVVGGGATGLSAALELAGRGYRVVVLEAGRVGAGASARGGGAVLAGFDRPAPAQLASHDARALWRLSVEALGRVEERIRRLRLRCDLRRGVLKVARRPRELLALRAERDALRRRYLYRPVRLVGRDELAGMLASRRYLGGVYFPEFVHLHPGNYILGLAAAASRAGARLHEGSRVQAIRWGPVIEVATAHGQVRCDHLLICGYDGPDGLTPSLRRTVLALPSRFLATATLGARRARELIASDAAVAEQARLPAWYRLSGDGRLLFGVAGLGPGADEAALRASLEAVFPQLEAVPAEYLWSSTLVATRNGLPHFGRVASNGYFAQGFGAQGVALADLAGRLMAEAIAGSAERFDLMARIVHRPFPGAGRLRGTLTALATAWWRLQDRL